MRVLLLAMVLGLIGSLECRAFYHPDTGRWLNRDPLGEVGGVNLYTYIRNQPPNLRDTFGLIGLPGSIDCGQLLRDIEELERQLAKAQEEGQDDPRLYAKLAELNKKFNDNCVGPQNPPLQVPCLVDVTLPENSNNRASFCSRHPVLCAYVGTGITVGVVCVLCPECCAVGVVIGAPVGL
jgi:hypothetical protein